VSTPQISVVIPAYRAESTIRATLESVLAQGIQDWEALVVDDGSDDGTGEIIRTFAARDPRIRLLMHPDGGNRGVSASRNLALSRATGKYVAFLDADDVWRPDALAVCSSTLDQREDVVLTWARARSFGNTERHPGPIRGAGHPGIPVDALTQLVRANVIVTSATLVRRASLAEQPFAPNLPFQIEDWVLWLDLAKKGPFLFRDEEIAFYRVRPEGATVLATAGHSAIEFELAQAEVLHHWFAGASRSEKRILRGGLAYRACDCLRQSLSHLRHARLGAALDWFEGAIRVARRPAVFLRAIKLLPEEHRRASSGLPPLEPPVPWRMEK